MKLPKPHTSAQIARLERISAQAVGTVLTGLHRRGMVERERLAAALPVLVVLAERF
ncbi:hypothetical protein [Nonomuraea angiospora]|uniref:hypothetical protein n=1 Tax=Nonomuraea angiospora TaxID=46172 RepID=UPI0029B87612|nr:hypothetical protein [Nonomuraea angiospora]MDX3105644.1 hypothetical protein [Nonomuraea angiospora]